MMSDTTSMICGGMLLWSMENLLQSMLMCLPTNAEVAHSLCACLKVTKPSVRSGCAYITKMSFKRTGL
jgi:hypothetical protein